MGLVFAERLEVTQQIAAALERSKDRYLLLDRRFDRAADLDEPDDLALPRLCERDAEEAARAGLETFSLRSLGHDYVRSFTILDSRCERTCSSLRHPK